MYVCGVTSMVHRQESDEGLSQEGGGLAIVLFGVKSSCMLLYATSCPF